MHVGQWSPTLLAPRTGSSGSDERGRGYFHAHNLIPACVNEALHTHMPLVRPDSQPVADRYNCGPELGTSDLGYLSEADLQ